MLCRYPNGVFLLLLPLCSVLCAFASDTQQENSRVSFGFPNGSLKLRQALDGGAVMELIIRAPKTPDQTSKPKIETKLIRADATEECRILNRNQVRQLVATNLSSTKKLSVEEGAFLAVLLASSDGLVIKRWGPSGCTAIRDGKWWDVFQPHEDVTEEAGLKRTVTEPSTGGSEK